MTLPDDASVDERLDHLDWKFLRFREQCADARDELHADVVAARDGVVKCREELIDLREDVEAVRKMLGAPWRKVAKAAGTFAGGLVVAAAPEHAPQLVELLQSLLEALAGGG